MADQLATPSDLASQLQSDIDASTATLLIEAATAVVQEAAGGQRILQVIGDTAELIGSSDSWLDLPQIPVTAIISVTLDGNLIAAGGAGSGGGTYRRVGNRLWRGDGWQTYCGEPSDVVAVNTHGYPPGEQELQLARAAVLSLASVVYSNPSGATREGIDDYTVAFEAAAAAMQARPNLRLSLRRQYGRRGGLVRLG